MIKLWAGKIKTEGNFYVDFFTVHWGAIARYVPITSF